MIELAAAVWKTNPYDTLERLQQAGLNLPKAHLKREAVQKYVIGHHQSRDRITQMWRRAQKTIESTPSATVRSLQRQYHLRLEGSRERWREGPGKLFGALPVNQIEPVFTPSPNSLDPYNRTKQRGVFNGKNWDEVLVMPLYDVPSRIRSFMFLGRSGQPATDQVFKATWVLSGKSNPEAGIGCLPAVEMAGDPPSVIASNDWLVALRAHLRTFKSCWTPIPLVVWRDDGQYRTLRSWNVLGDRTIIFWQFHMDAKLIRQAVYTDGNISLVGPKGVVDDKTVGHFLRDHPGRDLRKMIEQSSRPWRKALANWIVCNRQATVSCLLRDLEELGEDVSYILRQCGKGDIIPNRPAVRRQAVVGNKTFVELGDAWYTENSKGKREEVCDASIVFTHAIRDTQSGDLFYRGYIRYQGNRIHFIETDKTATGKLRTWLRDRVSRAGLGLVRCNWQWSNKLHDIAVAFETPQFVDDDLSDHVHDLREKGLLDDLA